MAWIDLSGPKSKFRSKNSTKHPPKRAGIRLLKRKSARKYQSSVVSTHPGCDLPHGTPSVVRNVAVVVHDNRGAVLRSTTCTLGRAGRSLRTVGVGQGCYVCAERSKRISLRGKAAEYSIRSRNVFSTFAGSRPHESLSNSLCATIVNIYLFHFLAIHKALNF